MSSDVSTNVTEWPVAAATLQVKSCREQSGYNNQQDSQIRYTHTSNMIILASDISLMSTLLAPATGKVKELS